LKSNEELSRKDKEDEKKIPIFDAANIKENSNSNVIGIKSESSRVNRLKDSMNGNNNNYNTVKDEINEED